MKIEYIAKSKGRAWEIGDTAEFKGVVEEGYALKYMMSGWAKPLDEAASKALARALSQATAAEAALVASAARERIENAFRAQADGLIPLLAAPVGKTDAVVDDQAAAAEAERLASAAREKVENAARAQADGRKARPT